jgi:transposase
MTGRQSSATERAIASYRAGMGLRAAARLHGIAYSTIWRAVRKLKEPQK